MVSAFTKLLLAAEQTNLEAAKHWGIGIAGLIGVFILQHWNRKLFGRYVTRKNSLGRAVSTVYIPFRRLIAGIVIDKVVVLPGRIWLGVVYLAINIACAFTNVNWALAELFFAKRMGWMALCNLCLSIFLGMKNTPLSPLTGRSYESVNVLHRFVGYTTIVCMILHSSIHVAGLFKYNSVYLLRISHQYAAMTAGLSMLIILLSTLIRGRQYELFYMIHIVFAVVIIITVTYHTYQPPNISTQTLGVTVLTIALFLADRILRLHKWVYYGYNNYAILTALPEGATRVTLKRSIHAAPGSHAVLYLPGVRAFETHPFSLVSTQPAEFVVNARSGFTRSLYEAALANGNKRFRVAIDGPYGQPPKASNFDKVVIFAGGSGATFSLSLALAWVRQPDSRKPDSSLTFVWSIKNKRYLEWFSVELAELQDCPAVQLILHVTRPEEDVVQDASLATDIKNKELVLEKPEFERSSSTTSSSFDKIVEYGRADFSSIMENAITSLSVEKTVLVAAAGPDSMMTDTRVAVAKRMRTDRPAIHLHLEEFGW